MRGAELTFAAAPTSSGDFDVTTLSCFKKLEYKTDLFKLCAVTRYYLKHMRFLSVPKSWWPISRLCCACGT